MPDDYRTGIFEPESGQENKQDLTLGAYLTSILNFV